MSGEETELKQTAVVQEIVAVEEPEESTLSNDEK